MTGLRRFVTWEKIEKINNKRIFLIIMDLIWIWLSHIFALWMRFDFHWRKIPAVYLNRFWLNIILISVMGVAVLYLLRQYRGLWAMAGMREVGRMAGACLTVLPFLVGIVIVLYLTGHAMPLSFYIMGYLLSCFFLMADRFAVRAAHSIYRQMLYQNDADGPKTERVMIIGAGNTGTEIGKELIVSKYVNDCQLCCFIDDDPAKIGKYLMDVPVAGSRFDIPKCAREYHITRIIYAIPSLDPQTRRQILDICKDTGCQLQTIPGIYQLASGRYSVQTLRSVSIDDLLGREQRHISLDRMQSYLRDKVILVIGGGGSIGSELCRQIVSADIRELIIFDIYENTVYDLQQELLTDHPDLKLTVLIGSVRDEERLKMVFETYHPDIVYHAAVYKNVRLLEHSAREAVKNNTIGAWNAARAAAAAGVKKFVLISTGKAVCPSSVMSASRRLAEIAVQMLQQMQSVTEFSTVRLGNVLGGSGSMIERFRQQIADGGPVKVADKNVTRYFMSVPEAVSLILEASYLAEGGEIFVLDMGEPIKIDDMARNLIRLSGLRPDVDIRIEYTGLRPGEKPEEEQLMPGEKLKETADSLIKVAEPIPVDYSRFRQDMRRLQEACDGSDQDMKQLIASILPSYHPGQAVMD